MKTVELRIKLIYDEEKLKEKDISLERLVEKFIDAIYFDEVVNDIVGHASLMEILTPEEKLRRLEND